MALKLRYSVPMDSTIFLFLSAAVSSIVDMLITELFVFFDIVYHLHLTRTYVYETRLVISSHSTYFLKCLM